MHFHKNFNKKKKNKNLLSRDNSIANEICLVLPHDWTDDCGFVCRFASRVFYSIHCICMWFVCLADRTTKHLVQTFCYFFSVQALSLNLSLVYVSIINPRWMSRWVNLEHNEPKRIIFVNNRSYFFCFIIFLSILLIN